VTDLGDELFEGPSHPSGGDMLEGPSGQEGVTEGILGKAGAPPAESLDTSEVKDDALEGLPPDLIAILKRVDKATQRDALPVEQAPEERQAEQQEQQSRVLPPFLISSRKKDPVVEAAPAPDQPVMEEPATEEPKPEEPKEESPPDCLPEAPSQLDTSFIKTEKKPEKGPKLEVGGELRSLEQALAKAAPGKLPSGVKKRAAAAASFLLSLKGAQRVLVAVENGETLEFVAAGGIQGEDYRQQTSLRLLNSVLRTGEPLLLLDTAKDQRFGKDKVLSDVGVKSALCVAFEDRVAGAKGVLYVDSLEEDNAFTHQDLRRVQDFGKRLAEDTHLGDHEGSLTQSKPEVLVAEVHPVNPWLYVAVVAILVAVTLPSIFGSDPGKKEVEQAPRITTRETAEPKTIVTGFLKAVQTRNYRSAYLFLSAKKQKKISLESFETLVGEFVSDERRLWVLGRLECVPAGGEGETLKEFELHPPRDGKPWKVVLQREDGAWRISSLKGDLTL
jgi:GAF domain